MKVSENPKRDARRRFITMVLGDPFLISVPMC
jgi:hypothetical protein